MSVPVQRDAAIYTDEYYFGDTVTVDTQVYRTIMASAFAPVYDLGTHYRESGSKVFMRMQGVEEEIQIYDFNQYLEDGIYEVKAGFKNGQFETCKLIKQ